MAKSANEQPTVKAVLVYAAKLCEDARRARDKDPFVELYAPSPDVARKVCQSMSATYGKDEGPRRALEELATRARRAEMRVEEQQALASAARVGLLGYQAIAKGERVAELDRKTLGRRLDDALRGLGVVSEVSAARLDSEPVSTGKSTGGGAIHLQDVGLERKRRDLLADAEHAVERIERELARTRRRLVEDEGMAA